MARMRKSILSQLLFGGDGGGSRVADLGLLAGRVGVGLFLALGHGVSKLPPDGTAGFAKALAGMGIPAPTFAAWAAMFAEFVCALLLALGLFTGRRRC
jgi:putative oxidoreductase